ncbi:hypothetical protein F5Y05DRAFT_399687 [Hypoxylon sp. FL0543]|nr:hypothetical protein F5Y05DRAFT_399687 [Hypoxylon sp. FL0543]
MPVNLPQLPNEILLQIFKLLRPSLTQETFGQFRLPPDPIPLARLCSLSKHLRELAEPLLYHTIPDQGVKTRTRLLRTLTQRPDLAEAVRAIDLDWKDVPANVLQDLFEARRGHLNLPENVETQLSDALRAGNAGAEVILILSVLPNIKLLEFACNHDAVAMVTRFFGDIAGSLEEQSGQKRPLSQLKELRLRHWDTEGATMIADVDDMLLPTVRILRGWAMNWEVYPGMLETPQRQLKLEHIDLSDSLCNAEGLANILSRCPDLRSLWIQWGSSTVGGGDELDFTRMGAALRAHGRKLEELMLDFREEFTYDQGEGIGRIGSLRELSSLKMLAIQQDVLVGDETESDEDSDSDSSDSSRHPALTLEQVLPASLEKLRLYSCQPYEESLDEQLYNMIAGGRMKNLRKIRVTRTTPFSKDVKKFGWITWKRWDMMLAKRDNRGKK